MAAIEPYSQSELPHLSRRVSGVVRRGGIIAMPTETFYGLGVNPFDEQAVERLLLVKGRAEGKPILVLIGTLAQLRTVARVVSPIATLLIDAFWPGPLTVLFPAHPSLPLNLTAGTGTVGVRLSSCRPLTELLRRVGPLTGTSANLAGAAPAQTAQDVQEAFGHGVDLIVDAGSTPGGMPSTVIDPERNIRLIREGAVTRQMIQKVLETHGLALM
jgi:L-threonylcarbamoyladenylate synthase